MENVPNCIILHHGGKWVTTEEWSYVGGKIEICNDMPVQLTHHDIVSLVSRLGYDDVIGLHYNDPSITRVSIMD